jgi:hypothetical protein
MQSRNKLIFIAALFLPLLALVGCGSQVTAKAVTLTTGTGGGGGGGGGGGSTTPTVSPMTVTVQTTWDDSELTTLQQTCTVPAGIVPGAAGSNLVCLAYVPEAQLYFSSLIFTQSTDSVQDCAIMQYSPYFYKMANTAGFVGYGQSPATTDCSVVPTPAPCYDGPATLVTDFPNYTGYYYLSAQGLSKPYSIASANSRFAPSNTWTSNSLGLDTAPLFTARGSSYAKAGSFRGYVAGSMHDYSFQCLDEWGQEHYSITIYVSDDPTMSGFVPPPGYTPSQYRAAWYLFP